MKSGTILDIVIYVIYLNIMTQNLTSLVEWDFEFIFLNFYQYYVLRLMMPL